MWRLLAIFAVSGLGLAACASTPSNMSSEDLMSGISPASPPPPENADEGGRVYEGGGSGRGSVEIPHREITIEIEDPVPAASPPRGDSAVGAAGGGAAGASGFVYPAIGSAFAGTRPDTPYVMQASGETPYWRSTAEFYERDGAVLARLSLIAVDEAPLQAIVREAPDHLANGYRRYVSAGGEGPRISAAYQAGPCVDGLGVQREFFTSIRVGETVYEGCARETGGQWDWSRDLLTRYDAIRVCLAEIPDAMAAVDAYSPTPDNTAVRVLRADRQRFECLIVNDGQRLASIRELDVTEVHLNEGRTVFALTPLAAGNACFSEEMILDADGETLGYLVHDLCQNPRAHVEGPLEDGES